MKFSAQLLALSFLVTDGARASHQQRREVASKDVESPIPGYGVFVPSWEISATPGGPKIILNGTAQEVHDQLLELNPNFDEDFGLHEPITEGSDTSDDAAGLTKRNIFPGNAGYNCFGRWGFVFTDTLWDGIDYLRRVGGQPSNGPGPGNCGRVSCSYRTAIHWCNDVCEKRSYARLVFIY